MKIERRRVLVFMGLTVFLPQWSKSSNIEFIDSSCKHNKKRKILVTYASEYGSTQGVAEAIGKTLCCEEFGVDVMYVNHVKDIEQYEQVIVGSPIQYDTWMDKSKSFVNRHEDLLAKKSVSYFFTCLTLSKKSEKTEKQAQGYANDLKRFNKKVKPRSIGQFAGVLDYSKFPMGFSLLAHIMFTFLGVKEGDYRDWNAIEKWSKQIKIKG